MFLHQQRLQYSAAPEAPDAVYARKLQEVIGDDDLQHATVAGAGVPMPPLTHPNSRGRGGAIRSWTRSNLEEGGSSWPEM